MRYYIIPGYAFGVVYGLAYGFFRMTPKAELSAFEHAAVVVLGSFTVAGGIGALAGFVLAFCIAAHRRWKYGRSEVIRD